MAHIHFKKRLTYALLQLIAVVLLIEWLSYAYMPLLSWPSLPSSRKAVRILLVADPQLLGDQITMPYLFGFLEKWDSDRFIQKTFGYSLNYVNPDIVIVLGDNFDEGEIASDKEFSHYVERFVQVFHKVDFDKVIFVPGDNDIGGEEFLARQELLDRFDKYFRKDVFLTKDFLDIVKINALMHSSVDAEIIPPMTEKNRFRIVISHMPLISFYVSPLVKESLAMVKPHLIFTAHEHTSALVVSDRETGSQMKTTSWATETSLQHINLTDKDLYQILVPTCSYRMGTDKIGFGAAVIEPDGSMKYAILWSPSRLKQLVCYLLSIAIAILILGTQLYVIALQFIHHCVHKKILPKCRLKPVK